MGLALPTEIYDLIVSHVEDGSSCWEPDIRRYRLCDYEARQILGILRLVNRNFYLSASSQLFRHIVATERCPRGLVRLRELSRSPLAVHVRQVDLGFSAFGSFLSESSPLYVDSLAALLSTCLARLPNLRAIDVTGPPLDLPREKANLFIRTIVVALRHVPLPKLTELNLSFAITHDFSQFFLTNSGPLSVPVENILKPLRHLELHVAAYTNMAGDWYRQTPVQGADDSLPNEDYANSLIRLVELAPGIKSLAIHCTDMLNLDSMNFSHTLRLQSLHLERTAVSSETLIALIQQCWRSLRDIELWHVQLNSGTWDSVLSQVSQLPNLTHFVIGSCGYHFTGISFGSTAGSPAELLPSPDDFENIETCHGEDIRALGALQRRVNGNRVAAGLPPFTKYDYRYLAST